MTETVTIDALTKNSVSVKRQKTITAEGSVSYTHLNIGAVLTVIKPDNIQPSGTYLTDQLNLQELSLKGSTDDFCTRLYPYGAIDESTGLPLTIAAVNDGTEYVDNHTYSDKVISAIWSDERYTDCLLYTSIFGDSGTQKILAFYDNAYFEMSLQVFPFIVDVVKPRIEASLQQMQQRAKQNYISSRKMIRFSK